MCMDMRMLMVVVVIMLMVVLMLMVVVMVVVMVMVMVMMVVMRLFFLPVHENTEMRADDAAFHRRLNGKSNARQADCIHLADERILVVQKFIQGGGEHVAGRTHSAIQIQRFHCLSL